MHCRANALMAFEGDHRYYYMHHQSQLVSHKTIEKLLQKRIQTNSLLTMVHKAFVLSIKIPGQLIKKLSFLHVCVVVIYIACNGIKRAGLSQYKKSGIIPV